MDLLLSNFSYKNMRLYNNNNTRIIIYNIIIIMIIITIIIIEFKSLVSLGHAILMFVFHYGNGQVPNGRAAEICIRICILIIASV
jgi:hypothetical protein